MPYEFFMRWLVDETHLLFYQEADVLGVQVALLMARRPHCGYGV